MQTKIYLIKLEFINLSYWFPSQGITEDMGITHLVKKPDSLSNIEYPQSLMAF